MTCQRIRTKIKMNEELLETEANNLLKKLESE